MLQIQKTNKKPFNIAQQITADKRLIKVITKYYNKLSTIQKAKYELAAIDNFLFWSRKTWCQFTYIYRDNAKNRKLSRAGQSTGIRFGTRNLNLIPSNKLPKSRNPSIKNIRYFDTGKFGANIRGANGKYKVADGGTVNGLWRSCGYDKVVILVKIWSFDKNKFVADFAEFLDKKQID